MHHVLSKHKKCFKLGRMSGKLEEISGDENEGSGQTVTKSKKRKNPFLSGKEDKERRQKKKARLIVRNISYKTTEDVLRKYFEQWGTLTDVNLLKRNDGKLVGCAFVQFETINQATKAILRGNNKELLGRSIYIDWALGKDLYTSKLKDDADMKEKKPKLELKEEDGDTNGAESLVLNNSLKEESNSGGSEEDSEAEEASHNDEDGDEDSDSDHYDSCDDKNNLKSKADIKNVKTVKHISNDVQEGHTVFIKNVPFDAEDGDLRKVCRKYGLVQYAIINRDRVSGHSKGSAFVKFKSKESAEMCLQAGTDFKLMDEVLDPHPALSRDEIQKNAEEKLKGNEGKDSRNLYLAREGLIMSGSKAAEGVSASDMSKRHKLEQIKTQVLKNLNRFVSRNRLSIHNLPMSYDNEKLKQMVISYTNFKPHECRVLRENKITAEHPEGKSKGFGFMSFSTHQEALIALRKLNNNPQIFGTKHRPIVAFSIEDRAVQKVKETRQKKSKLNNPTYKEKLERRKEVRKQKRLGKLRISSNGSKRDDKVKLKAHIEKMQSKKMERVNANITNRETVEKYVGTEAKPGTSLRMRSFKKIREQSQEHLKRVKADKRKEKQHKIKSIHLAERKAVDRTKQRRKIETDNLSHLVSKYKRMLDGKANGPSSTIATRKPKRTKWYTE